MQQVRAFWTTLDTTRQLLLAGLGAVAVIVTVFIAQLGLQPAKALLYAGLEEAAAGEVIQALEARNIAYEVRGDAIYVPSPARDELRLMLASAGLPANSHTGYELLDSLTGFWDDIANVRRCLLAREGRGTGADHRGQPTSASGACPHLTGCERGVFAAISRQRPRCLSHHMAGHWHRNRRGRCGFLWHRPCRA